MTRALRLAACLAMAVTPTAAFAQGRGDKAEDRGSKPVVVTRDMVRGDLAGTICMDASSSFHTEGRPLTFAWDFGDGRGAATTARACHEYKDAGLYAASITVTDDRGVSASRVVIVSVTPTTTPGM